MNYKHYKLSRKIFENEGEGDWMKVSAELFRRDAKRYDAFSARYQIEEKGKLSSLFQSNWSIEELFNYIGYKKEL